MNWINEIWYIPAMEYYPTEKSNKILIYATISMKLKNIILTEISQTEKYKYHMIPLI